MARTFRFAGVLVAVALTATACASSGSQYVANREERVFVKVPKGWAVLRDDPTTTTTSTDASAPKLPWSVVLDADRSPSRDHLSVVSPPAPIGFVYVGALTDSQRDVYSLAGLRSLPLGADPLADDFDDSRVHVLGYVADFAVNGYHGNRIRLSLDNDDGSTTVIDQVALLDAARTRIYVVRFHCERTCFSDHLSEITSIVDSLQIRKEQK
jgi:hypothetical protein